MTHTFPRLELQPQTPDDVLLALDITTSRPRVWDEHGMPLDSFYSDDLHPTRHPDDYAHVDPAVGYEPRIVQNDQGYGENQGLMDYIRPHVPEMLHLTIDAARAFRTVQGIPAQDEMSISEGLTVSFGLNSLWALLMYRSKHRVSNGELPVHVADLHRTFVGYEGVLDNMYDPDLPTFTVPVNELSGAFIASTDGPVSHEHCPAPPPIIMAGSVALQLPTDEAKRILAPLLEECTAPRLLADLHVDDETFSNFAIAVRQLAETQAPEDLEPVKRLLNM